MNENAYTAQTWGNGMGEKDKEFLQEELISSQPNKNTTKIKT